MKSNGLGWIWKRFVNSTNVWSDRLFKRMCVELVRDNRVKKKMKNSMRDDDFRLCRSLYTSVDYASFSFFAVLFQSSFIYSTRCFIYFPPPFDKVLGGQIKTWTSFFKYFNKYLSYRRIKKWPNQNIYSDSSSIFHLQINSCYFNSIL